MQYPSGLPRGFHPDEGNMLVAPSPYPVKLYNSGGNRVASAKWVGIQWDRSEGEPDRLIYGSTTYAIEGAYGIEGDISSLIQLVEPILLKLSR